MTSNLMQTCFLSASLSSALALGGCYTNAIVLSADASVSPTDVGTVQSADARPDAFAIRLDARPDDAAPVDAAGGDAGCQFRLADGPDFVAPGVPPAVVRAATYSGEIPYFLVGMLEGPASARLFGVTTEGFESRPYPEHLSITYPIPMGEVVPRDPSRFLFLNEMFSDSSAVLIGSMPLVPTDSMGPTSIGSQRLFMRDVSILDLHEITTPPPEVAAQYGDFLTVPDGTTHRTFAHRFVFNPEARFGTRYQDVQRVEFDAGGQIIGTTDLRGRLSSRNMEAPQLVRTATGVCSTWIDNDDWPAVVNGDCQNFPNNVGNGEVQTAQLQCSEARSFRATALRDGSYAYVRVCDANQNQVHVVLVPATGPRQVLALPLASDGNPIYDLAITEYGAMPDRLIVGFHRMGALGAAAQHLVWVSRSTGASGVIEARLSRTANGYGRPPSLSIAQNGNMIAVASGDGDNINVRRYVCD